MRAMRMVAAFGVRRLIVRRDAARTALPGPLGGPSAVCRRSRSRRHHAPVSAPPRPMSKAFPLCPPRWGTSRTVFMLSARLIPGYFSSGRHVHSRKIGVYCIVGRMALLEKGALDAHQLHGPKLRPFADEQTLSLEAVKDDSHPGHAVDCGPFRLLKTAAIYGPNASARAACWKPLASCNGW